MGAGAFIVTIHFEDLTAADLGALLRACSLRFDDTDAPRGWKLGLGRPLGLGSVANTIAALEIADDTPGQATAGPRPSRQPVDPRDLEQQALDWYLPAADDRCVLAGIAAIDATADHTHGYLPRGQPPRRADQRWEQAPTAAEILGCNDSHTAP